MSDSDPQSINVYVYIYIMIVDVSLFVWYSIVLRNLWGGGKKTQLFIHLSLGKAVPFTLES